MEEERKEEVKEEVKEETRGRTEDARRTESTENARRTENLRKAKNFCRKLGRSVAVAFSIYSVIPMPKFTWLSEEMDLHLIFFPWVGAVVGVLEWLWILIVRAAGIGVPAYAAVAVVIPLLVTGGFHLDGYLDTMDAIHSYQTKEAKLKIMEDPHVGAFAVVWTGIWFLLFYAGASELVWSRVFGAWCMTFFLVRALSGLAVVFLPSAKKEGMLQTFSDTAKKNTVRAALIVEACLCCVLMGAVGGIAGFVLVLCAGTCYFLYRFWAQKKFNGITGDMAGYFVSITELVCTLAAGIMAR